MLTREVISREEARRRELDARVHETYLHRDHSPAEWQAWQAACSVLHSRSDVLDGLWGDRFSSNLKAGQREEVEDAILYLEVNPWYFGSGYLKEKLLKGLRQASLEKRDCQRLLRVILDAANGPNRREFRCYCQLAVRIEDPRFRESLQAIRPEHDLAAKGKFSYLRDFIDRACAAHK